MNWLVILVTVGTFALQIHEYNEAVTHGPRSAPPSSRQDVDHDSSSDEVSRDRAARDVIPGITGTLILDGWSLKRLVGHVFLHGGLVHLLGNMLFLWIFGNAICATLGNIKYLCIYLLLGVSAGVCHLLFSSAAVLGASGAINGVVGMCLFLFPLQEVSCLFLWLFPPCFKRFEVRCLYMILWWLLWDIVGVLFWAGSSGVAYWAHLGGFGAGVGIAWLLARQKWIYLDKYDTSITQMWQRRERRALAKSSYDRTSESGNETPKQTDTRSDGVAQQGDLDRTDVKTNSLTASRRLPIQDGIIPSRTQEGVIRLNCKCGKRIKVPAQYAGQSGRCPRCKQRIVIPKAL